MILLEVEVSNETIDKLLEMASGNIACDCHEGVLLDNYILHDADSIDVAGKSSKYIIIKERFVNTWTSGYTLIMTDSYDEVERFEEIFSRRT